MSRQQPSTAVCILRQLCPRCREGRIFRSSVFSGWPRIHERCPVCDLKFEREEGYFLGAMYISYGMSLATITAIALLLWALLHPSFENTIIWAVVLFLPLAFPITFFARVMWLYLDHAFDPEVR